jgi:hypothetical protein
VKSKVVQYKWKRCFIYICEFWFRLDSYFINKHHHFIEKSEHVPLLLFIKSTRDKIHCWSLILCVCVLLGYWTQDLCMLGKHLTIELHPQPLSENKQKFYFIGQAHLSYNQQSNRILHACFHFFSIPKMLLSTVLSMYTISQNPLLKGCYFIGEKWTEQMVWRTRKRMVYTKTRWQETRRQMK